MEKDQELLFPTKGLDLSLEFDRQPEDTTVYARNVRTNDRIEFRDRGGSRAGLSKYLAAKPGQPDRHVILTITSNGAGGVRVTCGDNPQLLGDGSEVVTITGSSEPSYNVAFVTVSSLGPGNSFEVTDIPYTVDGTGGTWSQ